MKQFKSAPKEFRVYNLERKKFYYFGLLDETNEEMASKDLGGNRDLPVTQYTGLKDKNGVKIFEGDVFISNYDGGAKK